MLKYIPNTIKRLFYNWVQPE